MRTLFQHDAWLGLRAMMFVVLSLLLMVFDHRFASTATLRSALAEVVLPLQYLVDVPVLSAKRVWSRLGDDQTQAQKRQQLEQTLLQQQVRLQRFEGLEQENQKLRALLHATDKLDSKLLVARLLSVRSGLVNQGVILDVGSNHQVYVGQPVLDAYGVMGQVVQVSPSTAYVLLVSDAKSGMPVKNVRTGVRAIAAGSGFSDYLKLMYVGKSADVKAGDRWVTSGMGGHFPAGYPVGKVTRVANSDQARFSSVWLKPAAHLDRSQSVVLLWPQKALSNEPQQAGAGQTMSEALTVEDVS